MTERNFIEKTPFTDPSKAAEIVVEMIQRAGSPGHVWYHQSSDRVRVCAPDYQGEDGEVLLGVYDRTATRSRIAADIRAVRTGPQTVKRTRSVTVSESVETTEITKNIPENIPAFIHREPEPVAVIQESEPLQEVSEPLGGGERLPKPAPLPALPAPAKDDAYCAAVWALIGERDKIDARIGELQLLRALFDRKASDRLAFFFEDYCDLLDLSLGCMGESEEAKIMEAHKAEAREWARRFALHANLGDDSIFLRAAKQLAMLSMPDPAAGEA